MSNLNTKKFFEVIDSSTDLLEIIYHFKELKRK